MREGRGRISSLDAVPEEGQEDIAWAMEQLNLRSLTQAQILSDLNGRLADKALPLISKSAFNRRSMRIARQNARYAEKVALVKALSPQMTPQAMEETDRVVGELQKMLILEIMDRDASALSPKNAMELARGYLAVIQGQKLSAERRSRLEKEFKEKAGAAVDTVARKAGLSAETVDQLKAQILGIRQDAAA